WIIDPATARAQRLTEPRLNAVAGPPPCVWMPSSTALLCKTIPAARGQAPTAPSVPTAPVVQENLGRKTPGRTLEDMLQSPSDEAIFECYMTAELDRIGLDGTSTRVGAPATYARVEPSPSGTLFFVETIHRPYSYTTSVSRFPRRLQLWDATGKVVRELA